ncbi:hypothetical protein EIL50_05330 [bacterium NHP-B]|nr:hypothetical protein EIL50_05330 [bacterium NHP-B]
MTSSEKASLVVKKFGGTSLGTLDKIAQAADHILSFAQHNQPLIVVTSAMGGVTDQLSDLAIPHFGCASAEHDALLTSGEHAAAALMALCLQKAGRKSRSWQAWQIPIEATTEHGDARITHIHLDALHAFMDQGGISIVTGFQGITKEKRVASLGRGGSDITALALAAWFKRTKRYQETVCHIHTDVEGVYTADPRDVPQAWQCPELDYDTMHQLSQKGAYVLHPRSVDYARQENIPIYVRLDTSTKPGTWVRRTCKQRPPLLMAKQNDWMALHTPASTCAFTQHLARTHPHACVMMEKEQHTLITRPLWTQNKHMFSASTAPQEQAYSLLSCFIEGKKEVWRVCMDDLRTRKDVYIREPMNETCKRGPLWSLFLPTAQAADTMASLHTHVYPHKQEEHSDILPHA